LVEARTASLVTEVIGDPGRSGGPHPCRWRTCCARAGHAWGATLPDVV